MSQKFIAPLESVRGIAALMVAISHSFLILKFGNVDKLWLTPIFELESIEAVFAKLIISLASGEAAVTMFFILSGVVLGLSLDYSKHNFRDAYKIFLIKRVFRIYPLHIIVMLTIIIGLISVGGKVTIDNHDAATSWFLNWYKNPLTTWASIKNLILISSHLNPVVWTLILEMVVALFFPIMHWASRKKSMKLDTVIILSLLMISFYKPSQNGLFAPHIYKFYLGLFISLHAQKLISLVSNSIKFDWRWYSVAILFMLIEYPLVNGKELYSGYGFLQSIGGCMLILALLAGNVPKIFEWQLIQKLGRQSYSFYLWHFPIVYLSGYLVLSYLPPGLLEYSLFISLFLCVISTFIAYHVSTVSFEIVEKNFVLISKKLSVRFPPNPTHDMNLVSASSRI